MGWNREEVLRTQLYFSAHTNEKTQARKLQLWVLKVNQWLFLLVTEMQIRENQVRENMAVFG